MRNDSAEKLRGVRHEKRFSREVEGSWTWETIQQRRWGEADLRNDSAEKLGGVRHDKRFSRKGEGRWTWETIQQRRWGKSDMRNNSERRWGGSNMRNNSAEKMRKGWHEKQFSREVKRSRTWEMIQQRWGEMDMRNDSAESRHYLEICCWISLHLELLPYNPRSIEQKHAIRHHHQ